MPVQEWAFESPTGETRYGAQAFTVADGPVGDIRWRPELDFPRLTLDVGNFETSVPYSPAYAWTLSADGGVTIGTSDRYRIEVRRIDGTTLVIERPDDLVPVHPDEAEWRRRWTIQNIRNSIDPEFDAGMDIPDHKPAYIGFAPDAYGGTWVRRRLRGRSLHHRSSHLARQLLLGRGQVFRRLRPRRALPWLGQVAGRPAPLERPAQPVSNG